MTASTFGPRNIALALLPVGTFILFLASLADLDLCQRLLLGTTYYLHLALVLCWVALLLQRARALSLDSVRKWTVSNWPGIVIAIGITLYAAVAIEPALRVLSDEANLTGISRNLFSSKSPTFTLSGKNYYENYWDVEVVIDQRPTLFPFFVSLLHTLLGYSFENAFHLNLIVLPLFIICIYQLGRDLGGTVLGVVAALFSVAHPIVLLSVRSGGFDFFATFFSVLVLKSLLDFIRKKRPEDLALLWVHLCLFASIRYESAILALPLVVLLIAVERIDVSTLRPYALLYATSPAFLLPRVWLSLLRGNVPKQDPGTVTFSAQNFVENAREYFLPLLDPLGNYPGHSAVVIALGVLGCGRWLWLRPDRKGSGKRSSPESRFALLSVVWILTQIVIVFTYVWGRAQYPSAARLVMPIDVFFSLLGAWMLVRTLRAQTALFPILTSVGIVVTQLPVASRATMMNELTETRENAAVWRFFRRLGTERILIVSPRPIHFTIMNYGAMTFESARNDPFLFTALDRRLFGDIYLVQHIQLSTGKPLPGYEFWSSRDLITVHEFQNEANVLVRIAKVERAPHVTENPE